VEYVAVDGFESVVTDVAAAATLIGFIVESTISGDVEDDEMVMISSDDDAIDVISSSHRSDGGDARIFLLFVCSWSEDSAAKLRFAKEEAGGFFDIFSCMEEKDPLELEGGDRPFVLPIDIIRLVLFAEGAGLCFLSFGELLLACSSEEIDEDEEEDAEESSDSDDDAPW
jgi:hypothetical protein